jgi:hypothetical protein
VDTSNKCRTRAEILFNKEDRYKEYLAIYEQILKENIII